MRAFTCWPAAIPAPPVTWLRTCASTGVAGWGMITEGGADGADALLGVRLKTTGKAINEIETLVVRRVPFGRTTFPERLLEPSAAMAQILEPADRGTREDLIQAANDYLAGVSRDDSHSGENTFRLGIMYPRAPLKYWSTDAPTSAIGEIPSSKCGAHTACSA